MAEETRPGRRALSDRLAQIELRLAALEQRAALGRPAQEESAPDQTANGQVTDRAGRPQPEADTFGPIGDPPPDSPSHGQVNYSGDVTLHGRVVWNIGLGAQETLDLPGTRSAAVLAGLGHPTRAALTRRLLAGPATTAELQQVLDGSSTGQLYHHLRTMTACGLAEQDGRGRYRVPPTAVVPALVLLLAAADLAGDLG